MTIERARLSIGFCLGRLRAQTEELANRQYPGDHPGPASWLNLVNGVLDTAEDYIAESEQARSTHAGRLAHDAARLCSLAYTALNFLQGAATDELAYPLVPPLQRWLDDLGLQSTAIFRAAAVANYELARVFDKDFKRIRSPSKRLADAIQEITWPVLRITVPSKAFAIIPHFAIVAHEIGHALFERVPWDISAFAREEKRLVGRVAARLKLQQLDPATNKTLVSSFAKWFQELASDAFALYLTGPAIFFSLCDFAQLLGGGYGLSDCHPAHDLRRRILFRELKKGGEHGFAGVFKRFAGAILSESFNSALLTRTPSADDIFRDAVSGALNRMYDDRTAAVIAELHGSIEVLVPIIYSQVKVYLEREAPTSIYTSLRFGADLRHHLAPMLAAIPPVELPRARSRPVPTEFPSILNVGWITLLAKLGKLRVATESDTDLGRLETLHGLLLKAVELSEIRREWESAK